MTLRESTRAPSRGQRIRLRLALLLVAGLLTLVSAACGGGGGGDEVGGGAAQGSASAGKAVFEGQGCGRCHTFTPAGSQGTLGPDLDEGLKGRDAAFVRESIVDPNAEVTEGFSAGVMPQDYGEKLSDRELSDLVAFLTQGG